MRSLKSLLLLLVVLFYGPSFSLYAQFVSTNGPTGTSVHMHDFIEHDGAWFLAANDYILKSTNEGHSWMVLNQGLPQVNVSPRAFASFNGHLYVSTNSQHRMIRSNDGGETWQTFNTNLPSFFGVPTFLARKMVVNNGRMIALPHGTDPIYYLTEGATSWTSTNFSGVGGGGLRVIDGNTLYASIGSRHRISTDNGSTWADFPANPPNSAGGVGATDFLKVGDRVILTTNAGGNNGVYFSDNNLQTWSAPQGIFFSGNASTEKLAYINDNHILALSGTGLMKSTDQGSSWIEVTNEDTRPDGQTTFIKKLSGNRILVGSTSGLYMYDNNGDGEFSQINIPLGNTTIYETMEFNGQLLTFHNGIVASYDKAVNRWINQADLRELGIAVGSNQLALDHMRMYKLGNNLVLLAAKKAFISSNGIEFEPMNGISGFTPVSFHSVGSTWIMVNGVPGNFNNWIGGGIYYSEDEGQSWTQATAENFPTMSSFSPNFYSSDLVDVNGNWFLLGNGRVYRSTDQGRNWNTVTIDAGNRYKMYPFDGALFVLFDESGIRKSTDNGATWQDYYTGLPTTNAFSRRIWGLTQVGNQLVTYNDASQNITPLQGETGFYVLGSANGTWQRDASIPLLPFRPAGFLTFESSIYAVWENVGIYTNAAVSTSIDRSGDDTERPYAVKLYQNYPNPFNPSTVINFELSTASEVQLQVFDLMGREIATLVDSRLPVGSHTVLFDGGQLSSGVYVYRLQLSGQIVSRKMVLVK